MQPFVEAFGLTVDAHYDNGERTVYVYGVDYSTRGVSVRYKDGNDFKTTPVHDFLNQFGIVEKK